MVFEDVHWIDPTSREALDLIIDRIPSLRVLAIITFRPEFTPPWLGRSHVTILALNRLPPRQRVQMITHVTGGKSLPKEIADQIVDRTDGVPLFIEELTKTVVESGLVRETGASYALAGPAAPLAIPSTLHGSLLARLDRLAPTREVAQIGAALGRSFSHELISAVAQMPQQKLDDALAQLVTAELIFRRGTPPDAEYTFKHALVQDAAYSTLLRSRRQQLHGRIVTTLEDQLPEVVTAQPALMAQHSTEAGLSEKALGYWLKAGRQAIARSAMTEAAAHLQKGLELLRNMPDNSEHRQQELDLRITLGGALIATKGWGSPLVGETYTRARMLAEQLARPEYQLPLLHGEWNYHTVQGRHRLALSLAEQLGTIARARNDIAARLLGHRLVGNTQLYLGELTAARAISEQCRGIDDPAIRAAYTGFTADDQFSVVLLQLGIILMSLGYIDQARSRISEGLSEARRLKHHYALTTALSFAGWATMVGGYPLEVKRYADERIALSNEHGLQLHLGYAMAQSGWVLSVLGDIADGLTLLDKGLAAVRGTGAVMLTSHTLTLIGHAHAMLGRPKEGLRHLAEAAEIIEATDERFWEPKLHRIRGELLVGTSERAAAERAYLRSLAVARKQSARLEELRASTSLARLWRDQGKRDEARDLLAPVYAWFTEGFDTLDLKEAKALLDELAV
jgi:predicted ATPase